MIPAKVALILPMLATDHVGELVATRDALVRALAAADLDLHDLARACVAAPAAPWSPGGASFGDRARACRDLDCGRLSASERAFVADMVRRGFGFRPSPRQAAWLDDILDRLRAREAA